MTISRAEYERLQQEKARNAKLEANLAAREQEQAQVITSLTLQNEWLLEQLKLSKKKLFGRSSEQAEQMVMEQLSLTYNELEAYAFGTKAATEKQIAVKAHERKRQSGNVLDSVLPIDLFEGERVQHLAHLLFCDKKAAHTIHGSVLHHQLQLIRQTQFLLRFRMVLFAEIVCFHLRMSSVISEWWIAQQIGNQGGDAAICQ